MFTDSKPTTLRSSARQLFNRAMPVAPMRVLCQTIIARIANHVDTAPRLQAHRLAIAPFAQWIVRCGDKVCEIERGEGAAGSVDFGLAPGGFDSSRLGVFAVVAWDELRGGTEGGIAGAADFVPVIVGLCTGNLFPGPRLSLGMRPPTQIV
jgi:hypothetical protein